jgi:hypothetical protein
VEGATQSPFHAFSSCHYKSTFYFTAVIELWITKFAATQSSK